MAVVNHTHRQGTCHDDNRERPAITIVLADDHEIVRSAIRGVLESEAGVEVVAEASDLEAAIRKVGGYKPDVLVLDLFMPDGSGIEAIPRFLERSPQTAIVVLTMDDTLASARAALRAGAFGYALKEEADVELIEAVRSAVHGRKYLDPGLAARAAIEDEPVDVPDNLSRREIDVLRLIALGYTNPEIAERLGISVRTVESHRSHLQHKLGAPTRADVVKYARDHHVVA